MKKRLIRIMACVMCASMLTGCGNTKTANSGNTSAPETEQQVADTDLTDSIKAKYAAADMYEYADPMYNVEADHVFTFENVGDDVIGGDWYSAFAVYSDNNFDRDMALDVTIEGDIDTHELTIAPNIVFDYRNAEGGYAEDGSWGSNSKFWLVQYVDLETNEELEKPIVTVFTIPQELDTPTLSQSVSGEGYYTLSWTPVEGADSYQVYSYQEMGSGYAELVTETAETTCDSRDIKPVLAEENVDEADTELVTDEEENQYIMNQNVGLTADCFFVVAVASDGKNSAMSNKCNLNEIANQIPYTVSMDFATEYTGDNVLALPAYVNMQMLDDSVGQYVIDYHGAEVNDFGDGEVRVNAKILNLPIYMSPIDLTGVDYDTFMADAQQLTDREDALRSTSVVPDDNINIPYTPSKDDTQTEEKNSETADDTDTDKNTDPQTPAAEPESETPAAEPESEATAAEPESETPAAEPESEAPAAEPESETPAAEPESEAPAAEPESETPAAEPESEAPAAEPESETPASEAPVDVEVSSDLADTIYANSAMSEWLALNMLNHEEVIPMDNFPEACDSEMLGMAAVEAYKQNPLIGIIGDLGYDCDNNSVIVSYVLDEDETATMQTESLQAAASIAAEITTSDMSAYEKEEAINQYLCEKASYNDTVMDYVNEDGSISDDVVYQCAQSFTPYGILVENLGVCESYSEAFQLIARAAGLESIIETGSLQGVNHEWNRVNIDGSWYSLDVTNNDNEYLPNCYFNLSDDVAAPILIENGACMIPDYLVNYTASDMNNEYYTKNGWYTDDEAAAAEVLKEKLADSSFAAVRMTDGACNTENIVSTVVNDLQLTSGTYYYNAGVLSIITE